MKKIIFAVFALATAVSTAPAEEMRPGFDGSGGATVNFGEMLASAGVPANSAPEPVKMEAPEGVVPVREVKINIVMKTGDKIVKDTVVCEAKEGRPAIEGCKKSSNSGKLTDKDISAMSLRKYFPEVRTDFTSLLGQVKHSYTNQSGPQTFHCEDACGKWDWSITISLFPPYLEEASWTCVEDSHECECIAGCY